MLTELLGNERALFRSIENEAVQRSFPSGRDLTPEAAAVLHQVLQDGRIPYGPEPGVRKCIEKGWLHSDLVESSFEIGADVICYFPTNLHRKYFLTIFSNVSSALLTQYRYVEYYLCAKQPRPFPTETFPSLAALCEAVLKCFSRKNLRLSIDRSTPVTPQRPPEAQFQDEFYRAFHAVVGHGVAISSEWACNSDWRVDFLIPQPGWGVEILRDGDRLRQHCDRFEPGGSYQRLVQNGVMTDWLVLDCCHTRPQRYCTAPSSIMSWRC